MSLPNDRKYAASHEWARLEGDVVVVGITENAQEQLGDLVFVGDVNVGAKLQAGDMAGVVESVKAASDIYAPVAGEVIEFNEALNDQPDLINQAAHDTWIFKMKPDNVADLDNLLDAAGYEASL
jgi:glycine cleavage system H protein